MKRWIVTYMIIGFTLLYSCTNTNSTEAREPLKLIDDLCLNSDTDHSNFRNMVYHNQYIFIAKGALGFQVIGVDYVNYPIANSISLSVKAREGKHTDFITVDDNNFVYTASDNQLIIYKLIKVSTQERLNIFQTVDATMNISTLYSDQNLIYIGGNRRLKVYSKSDKKIIYDYNDIDGNITSITAKDNRVYVALDKAKVEVLSQKLYRQ